MTEGLELQKSLVEHFRNQRRTWLAWREVNLGADVRADVVAMARSYRVHLAVYEVKVNRWDFQQDVRSGKFEKAFPHCHSFYYATPQGLVTKEELPVGCGLIVHGESGWHAVKGAAIRQQVEVPQNLLMLLLMKSEDDRQEEAAAVRHRPWTGAKYRGVKEATKTFGSKMARDVARGLEAVEAERRLRAEVEALLGQPVGTWRTTVDALREEIRRLVGKRAFAQQVVQLTNLAVTLNDGLGGAEYVPRELRAIANQVEQAQTSLKAQLGKEA